MFTRLTQPLCEALQILYEIALFTFWPKLDLGGSSSQAQIL